MPVTVIVGEQRGDEGKGRFTDMFAMEADAVGRGQGGPNAGHTVLTDDGRELDLHGLPSGVAHEGVMNIIGRGCLINASTLPNEIDKTISKGFAVSPDNLMISSGAHLILPHHISIDEIREAGESKQGSTKAGISPTAGAKFARRTEEALRAEVIKNDPQKLYDTIVTNLKASEPIRYELWLDPIDEEATAEEYLEKAQRLGEFITDTEVRIHKDFLQKGKTIVAEGAQAFLLDIDHGMWPYVTSTSTTANGVLNGLGIPGPKYVSDVVGVSKLVQSHVGGGPFVTEITDEGILEELHGDMSLIDGEKGTTTGRVRRLGYLDLPTIKRAQWVNGTTQMAVTKLDWIGRFGDTVKICTSYDRHKPDGTISRLPVAPDSAAKLEQCKPKYVELPVWKEDIQDVRKFDQLPTEARDYIQFIEKEVGLPITLIGVGPGRENVIDRRKELLG